ncbi:MAG: hypothetical protein K2Q45_08995 [Nitrosomonas sp.]|nr:hypothetical protein [Nitrosomonas sp.]
MCIFIMNKRAYNYIDYAEAQKKIKYKGVTPVLKRQCWERYIGIGILEAACPLCGVRRIHNNINSGFEVAHLISQRYLNEDLTLLYTIPSCAGCNNECSDLSVFDFLYCRGRIKPLKKLIMNVYELFTMMHGDNLVPEHDMAWRVLDHLYGQGKFPAGGGIVNSKQVYEIARYEQYRQLAKESARLARKLEKISNNMGELMECEIKTLQLT